MNNSPTGERGSTKCFLVLLTLCIVFAFLFARVSGQTRADTFVSFHPRVEFGKDWESHLLVINTGQDEHPIRLLAYNAVGALLGEIPPGPPLLPGEQRAYSEADGAWFQGTAALQIESSSTVRSFMMLESHDGNAFEVVPPTAQPSESFLIPLMEAERRWRNEISLLHVGAIPFKPDMIAFDRTGQLLGTVPLRQIAPNETNTTVIEGDFATSLPINTAMIDIRGNQPLAGLQVLGFEKPGDVAVLPAPLSRGMRLSLPIFQASENVPLWTMAELLNPNEVAVHVRAEAFDAEHRSLGHLSNLSVLSRHASHRILTENAGGILAADIAFLTITADQPITGYAIIGSLEAQGLTAVPALTEADGDLGYELIGSHDGNVLAAAPLLARVDRNSQSLFTALDPGFWKSKRQIQNPGPVADPASVDGVRTTPVLNGSRIAVGIDEGGVARTAIKDTTQWPAIDRSQQEFAAGATAGAFSVSHDGAALYSIPIRLPRGRGGFVPRELALAYNSNAGNGIAGVGFQLAGTSQIQRCTRHPTFGDVDIGPIEWNDTTFCMDGKRLIADGSNQYRLEDDPAYRIKITRGGGGTPEVFEAEDGAGNTLVYGESEESRVEDHILEHLKVDPRLPPPQPEVRKSTDKKRFAWSLSSVRNRFGQTATFTYAREFREDEQNREWGVAQRLINIAYDGFTVEFNYEGRPDAWERYIRGMRLFNNGRLGEIRILIGPMLIRRYVLSYEEAPLTKRSRLKTVKECDGRGACKAPLAFSWQDPDPTFRPTNRHIRLDDAFFNRVTALAVQVADLNNDGRDDLFLRTREQVAANSRRFFAYALSDGQGFSDDQLVPSDLFAGDQLVDVRHSLSFSVFGIPVWEPEYSRQRVSLKSELIVTDLNADGNPEFGVRTENGAGPYQFHSWQGGGSFTPVGMPFNRLMPYLGDINGDGLPDLVTKHDNPNEWRFLVNSPAQPGSFHHQFSLPESSHPDLSGALVMETNGDAQYEFLIKRKPDLSDLYFAAVNAAPGDVATAAPRISESFLPLTNNPRVYFDANGDGVLDLVEMPTFECGPSWGTGVTPLFRQGTGAGSRRFSLWGQYPQGSEWKFGESIAPEGSNLDIANCVFRRVDAIDNGVRAADLDGDGRQELLVLGERLLCQIRPDGRCIVGGVTPRRPFVARLRYDGSWETDTEALAGLEFSPPVTSYCGTGRPECGPPLRAEHLFGYKLTRILDIDGDGIPEILHPRMLGTPSLDNRSIALQVYKRESKKADLLASVTDSLGAKTEVTYAPMSDRSAFEPATDCSYPLHCPRRGRWLVRDVTRSTGAASPPTRRELHRYSGARVDLSGRDWLGFAQHVVTDEARNSETEYQLDNVTRQGRFYPFAGLVNRQFTTYRSFSGRFVRVENFGGYQNVSASSDRILVRPTGTCEARYDAPLPEPPPGRAPVIVPFSQVCTSYADYDSYGFARTTTRSGSMETLARTTTFEHRADQSPRILGIVTDVRETSTVEAESQTRTVTTVPDEHGLPKTQTIEPEAGDASLTLVTTFVRRDDVGLPLEITTTGDDPVTGPQTRTTITEYDSHGYPKFVINSEGHREDFSYDPGLGVLLSRRDANGVLMEFVPDGFGRVVETINPAGADTFVTYSAGPDDPLVVSTTQKEGETILGSTTIHHDILGRPRHRETAAPRSRTVHVWTQYDALGRAVAVSAPQFEPIETEAHFGSAEYDALNRVIKRTDPDGIVAATAVYDQLTSTVTNARGKKQVVRRDDLGAIRLSQTQDEGGNVRGEVTFGYGAFGTLNSAAKKLSGPALTTTMTYDRLGRRKSLSDPDRGTTAWTYNAFGDAVIETAADGQVETRRHDRLGRRVKTLNEQGVTDFVYDTCPGGIGALCRAKSPDDIVTTPSYDEFGRPRSETVNIPNVGAFTVERRYDAAGRLGGIRYPEVVAGKRFEVSYDYSSSAGAVLWRVKDGTGQTLWQAEDHSPFGVLSWEAFGNGLRTVRLIDPLTGLLVGIKSGFLSEPFFEETSPAPPPDLPSDVQRLQVLGYDYDPARNVQRSVRGGVREPGQSPVNVTEEFGYDDLNRLASWKVTSFEFGHPTGTVNYEYRFDDHGNLESRVPDVGESAWRFEYGGPRPHAIIKSTVGGVSRSYDYDGRGRRHKDGERTITYTRFELPKTITQGGSQIAEFKYDALGRRVRKFSAGMETLTIGGLYERVSPAPSGAATHRFHIEGPRRVVAEVEWVKRGGDISQEIRYLHIDRQGSVEIVTGGTPGQVLGRQSFEPYGNMVDPTNLAVAVMRPLVAGLRRGFTGHEHDEELGFVDMRGRVYDPRSTAFLSPDPVVAQPQMAHSFHPYAYVTHNPANFTDPTGFQQQASSSVPDNQEAPGLGEETVDISEYDIPGEPLSPTELDRLAGGIVINVSVSASIHVDFSGRPDSQTSDDNGSLRQPAPAKNSTVRKRSKVKTGTVMTFRTAVRGDRHSPGCTAGKEECDDRIGGGTGHNDRVVDLITQYRAASLSDYEAWDRAREDYRRVNLKGGDPILQAAEHFLFRYWLASTPTLGEYQWIPRPIPFGKGVGETKSDPWYKLPVNSLFMMNTHDFFYNKLRKNVLEHLFNITPTTQLMLDWENRGYDYGFCAAGRCGFRQQYQQSIP